MKLERYLIIFLLIASVAILSFFIPPFFAAALIPAVAFGAILLGNPRMLLFTYLTVMSVYPLLQTASSLGPLKYLDEAMGLSLFGVFFGHIAFRRMSFRDAKGFGRIAVVMLAYALISLLINRSSLRAAAQCLFKYFSFIPFYILALKYLKKGDFKVLLIGTLAFFWVNFALNLGWFAGINPLYNVHRAIGSRLDIAVGTLGGCNFVAYFCIMVFFLLVSMLNSKLLPKKRLRAWLLVGLGAILVQLYMTFTNHAYMIFALALIPYLLISKLWRKWPVLVLGVLMAAAVAAAFSFSEQLQAQFSKENIRFRYEKFSRGAKYQLFDALLVDNRKDNPNEWMFGVGPGSGIGDIGKDNLTPFALRILLPIYRSTEDQMQGMQMTSISGNTTSAVLTLWGDFGLAGFLIFCGFYIWLLRQIIAVAKTSTGTARVVAEFLVGALVFFLMINIFIDVLGKEAFTVWLWMWVALLNLHDVDSSDIKEKFVPVRAGFRQKF